MGCRLTLADRRGFDSGSWCLEDRAGLERKRFLLGQFPSDDEIRHGFVASRPGKILRA
jgi:hypothetical protein